MGTERSVGSCKQSEVNRQYSIWSPLAQDSKYDMANQEPEVQNDHAVVLELQVPVGLH